MMMLKEMKSMIQVITIKDHQDQEEHQGQMYKKKINLRMRFKVIIWELLKELKENTLTKKEAILDHQKELISQKLYSTKQRSK